MREDPPRRNMVLLLVLLPSLVQGLVYRQRTSTYAVRPVVVRNPSSRWSSPATPSPLSGNTHFMRQKQYYSFESASKITLQTSQTQLFQSSNNNNNEYSTLVRLREEAESPFRKVRFFLYALSLGGALTSLAVSTARIAAGLSGVNTDLLQQSGVNAAVDTVAIVVLGYLFQKDLEAQESRLKRAAKGAEFARLVVRGSANLLLGEAYATSGVSPEVAALSANSNSSASGGAPMVNVKLSSLRRGRQAEKRIILAAAGKERISTVLQEAIQLRESLANNDLVVVPVVYPQCTAPLGISREVMDQLESCVALPAGGGNWKRVLEDEAQQAETQGVDVSGEGICVVVKKNGRVGQRTKGIYLERFVGEVVQRKEMGLDVKNI